MVNMKRFKKDILNVSSEILQKMTASQLTCSIKSSCYNLK